MSAEATDLLANLSLRRNGSQLRYRFGTANTERTDRYRPGDGRTTRGLTTVPDRTGCAWYYTLAATDPDMNIFVQRLSRASVSTSPDLRPTDLVVEDNVGEGVHLHLRNTRLEMSIDDFETFAAAVVEAHTELEDGDR